MPTFDVKAFHDVVLGGGAVSLPVLREQIDAWIVEGENDEVMVRAACFSSGSATSIRSGARTSCIRAAGS